MPNHMNQRSGSKTPQRRFLLAWNNGGITSLKLQDDAYDTEYITPGETLGEVLVRYRPGNREWRTATTFASGDIRTLERSPTGDRGPGCGESGNYACVKSPYSGLPARNGESRPTVARNTMARNTANYQLGSSFAIRNSQLNNS